MNLDYKKKKKKSLWKREYDHSKYLLINKTKQSVPKKKNPNFELCGGTIDLTHVTAIDMLGKRQPIPINN